MNAYKLLSHIAIGAALIMDGCCTTYAANETVNVHSLSALANRVDAVQPAASTDHETTSSDVDHTQGQEGNTSSSVARSVVMPTVVVPNAAVARALMASPSAPVSAEQSHGVAASSSGGEKADASSSQEAQSHSSPQENTPSHPDLTPTGYIEALIAPLSVARDLGKNCQQVLSSNTGNQDICDQFDRAVDNLAQDQAKIEKTTPRPKDTKSVAPELMSHFNQLSQQLNQEVQYLRAYRATQK